MEKIVPVRDVKNLRSEKSKVERKTYRRIDVETENRIKGAKEFRR